MKKLLFLPRLAFSGIRKNRKLYLPYILSCTCMVAMFYIIHALSYSPVLSEMRFGSTTTMFCLTLGQFVIAVFSLLFLYYTSSFLLRRRNREFGLYNVLGMDKRKIGGILIWETLMIAVFSLVLGLGLGIAFYKYAELGLLNAIHAQIDYSFRVYPEGIFFTVGVFAVIFFLLLLRALWKVFRSKPTELLHSEATGEKPPKANWFPSMMGLALLACAYVMAVRIQSPITALTLFFVAVIMVILATYLLFISGSVALCRLLQKNRRYYYKANHFISVSSMAYRMRRNGAGLASICILSTMVLVMISSTSSLYFGTEEALRVRFPREMNLTMRYWDTEEAGARDAQRLRELVAEETAAYGAVPEHIYDYRYAAADGFLENGALTVETAHFSSADLLTADRSIVFSLLPLEDYNAMAGVNLTLEPGQVLAYTNTRGLRSNVLTMPDGSQWQVAAWLDDIPVRPENTNIMPGVTVIVPDYDAAVAMLAQAASDGDNYLFRYWVMDFDTGLDDATNMELDDKLFQRCLELGGAEGQPLSCLVYSRAGEGAGYYDMYGGLFFLGIALSIVFLFATVLIIYYKQVCEGYEDQARFGIMQSVGMTNRDIKKSINSQVLTVFFAPLFFAGLHLGFAYPLLWKMLQLFNLSNLNLLIFVTVGAYLVFALLYAAIYKITAGAYFSIVSKKEMA